MSMQMLFSPNPRRKTPADSLRVIREMTDRFGVLEYARMSDVSPGAVVRATAGLGLNRATLDALLRAAREQGHMAV
jgi:hypothetical protein